MNSHRAYQYGIHSSLYNIQYQKFGSNLETTLNRALDVVNGADSVRFFIHTNTVTTVKDPNSFSLVVQATWDQNCVGTSHHLVQWK